MRKYTNKTGFTLIELLAVIVVLSVIMMIAVTAVTGIINKSKQNAFLATARSYIDAVRQKIFMDGIALPTNEDESAIVYLDQKMVEKGGITSPYGSNFLLKEDNYTENDINTLNSNMETALSFVKITCVQKIDDVCQYSYAIYLSDGKNAIGCYDDEISMGNPYEINDNINYNNIKPLTSCQNLPTILKTINNELADNLYTQLAIMIKHLS